jgi:selenium-binding protein 1
VYGIDVTTNPREPRLSKVVEPDEILGKTGLSYLHSSHCLGSGEIMISAMGDKEGNAKGGFVLLDQDFKVKGTWADTVLPYGYDFWYQPRHSIMVSSGWGAPCAFTKGFDPSQVPTHYSDTLYFWDWKQRKVIQEISLGQDGLIPLEIRFKHDPSSVHGYVGAALSSNVIHFTKDDSGKWVHDVAIRQAWTEVEGWVLPQMPPLITDILISLDDRFLYFSNWLRGDVCQYDISDPANPKLAGRVWLGGSIRKGGPVKVTGGLPEGVTEQPEIPTVQGHELHGGPQMLQLSLDGKRLYVTNSLFSAWDKQFYPDMVKRGSYLLQLDVDNVNGGLSINHDFYIDFGAEPGGPALAHEVRYPGGDCSSDIWE